MLNYGYGGIEIGGYHGGKLQEHGVLQKMDVIEMLDLVRDLAKSFGITV